jgi:hypothetical protein
MKFTRREILTAFLGLPFALAACRQEPENFSVAGELVGQSVDFGHLIREHRNIEVSDDKWENVKVGIVGGGIAGLSTAWKFQKENFNDFLVLELEKEIGGTARSGKNDFISYPWAAHYLPVPFKENTELISFLDEMKLIEGTDRNGELVIPEQFLCREPEERVFYKGRWYEGLYLRAGASEEDLRQYSEFYKQVDYWINWRNKDGKRAFVLPIANCSTDAEVLALDKLSFADWLKQKGFDSERLFWYCDYATRDDYGLKIEQTSAWAGLFYFCSRVRKSGEESQPFITFPEGNGHFTNYLSEKVKDKIRLKSLVMQIIPNEKGVDVVYLNTETNEVRGIHCEKIVFSSPIFTAKYLIRGFSETWSDEFQHNAWFVANLTLKDRPKSKFAKDFPLAWDNVLYESNSLGYVVATHQKGMDYGPTVFTYYYPMCNDENARAKLFALSHQEIADIVLTDLSRAHKDIRELTTRIDVMRWGHAMISPRPNFLWSGVRELAQKPYKNIYFAHSDLSGVALFEEAFYHGMRVAKEILK